MKKQYQTPKIKVVQLKHRATLLEGSGLYHGPGAFNISAESSDIVKG